MPPCKPSSYLDPLIIPPLRPDHHTHTLILLHGRGSNAARFGPELLDSACLRARLPTVKFVFPTASKRRATIFKRIPINQWFDNHSLEDPGHRTDLQIEGLCQTADFLRGLVEEEAGILGVGGYQRVVLGGLSQGCAASIFTLLGGGFGADGHERLGGFVGLSGWLPFEKQLRDLSYSQDSDDVDGDDDLFGDDEENNVVGDARRLSPLDAVNHVRDILDLPLLESSPGRPAATNPEKEEQEPPLKSVDYLHQLPVFIGHGSLDPKVSVRLGEGMADFLSTTLKMKVTWKAYEGLGHWYRVEDEIEDMLAFLKVEVGIPVSSDPVHDGQS
ncbi:hypothetical protein VTN49DRAFT_5865 [Thermomyces lanuginosus]|uniref:uncharacterized protein n=1 Tax=Thermomyces lanuginosus TaxID=5541 RepID=UPI0037431CEF